MFGPQSNRHEPPTDRGVSDAINFIILFGVVLSAAGFIVGFGGQVVDDTRKNAEIEHAENAFAKLDSKASASALGRTGSRSTISLGTQTSPEASTSISQDGQVRVISKNISTGDTEEIVNRSLGKVVYNNAGETIAYQGGGVFRQSVGDDQSTIVSPPEVRYRGDTLTMPLIALGPNSTVTGDATELSVQQAEKTTLLTNQRRVEGTQITIEITSDFYRAWGNYFETRVGDKTEVTYYDSNNTVQVNLGLPKTGDPTYDGGVVSTGDVLAQNSTDVNGPVIAEGDIDNVNGSTSEFTQTGAEPLDAIIQSHVKEARANGEDLGVINESMTLDGGLYYSKGIEYDSSKKFDADGDGDDDTNGLNNGTLSMTAVKNNITLVVDGDINVGQTAKISAIASNANNTSVRVLTTGDVLLGTGSPIVRGNLPENLQIYGTSETDLLISQNATFRATYYAPTDSPSSGSSTLGNGNGNGNGGGAYCEGYSYDACIGGNADVDGAIVTGTVRANNDASIKYRESLAGLDAKISPVKTRPRLVYLHMSISEIDIKAD